MSELIREAILRANQKLVATFRAGDAEGVARLYTEGALLLPAGSEPVQGTAAIRDFWYAVLASGVREVQLETIEVDAAGSTAIEMGQYTLFANGGHLADRGKYIVIWKETGGEWKLHRDIWNTSLKG